MKLPAFLLRKETAISSVLSFVRLGRTSVSERILFFYFQISLHDHGSTLSLCSSLLLQSLKLTVTITQGQKKAGNGNPYVLPENQLHHYRGCCKKEVMQKK